MGASQGWQRQPWIQESRDLRCRATVTSGLSEGAARPKKTHLLLAYRLNYLLGWLSTVAATISHHIEDFFFSFWLGEVCWYAFFRLDFLFSWAKISKLKRGCSVRRLQPAPVSLDTLWFYHYLQNNWMAHCGREVNVRCLLHRDDPFKTFKSLQRRIEIHLSFLPMIWMKKGGKVIFLW